MRFPGGLARHPSLGAVPRLFAFFCLLAYLGILAGFWIFGTWIAAREVAREQKTKMDLVEDSVLSFLDMTRGVMVNVAALVDPENPKESRRAMESLRGSFQRFSAIYLLDPRGRVVEVSGVSAPDGIPGYDLSREEFFIPARDSGEAYATEVFVSAITGRLAVSLAVPLLREGSFAGELVGELDLGYLGDLVAQIGLHDESRTLLVDRKGTLIAHPDAQLVRMRSNMLDREHLRLGLEGEVAGSWKDPESGETWLVSAKPLGNGWAVASETRIATAYGSFTRLLAFSALTMLLVFLGLLGAIVASLRRIIPPIKALALRATGAAGGSLEEIRIPHAAGQYREIAGLIDEFNAMLGAIASRTRDLDESRSRLASYFEKAPDAILILEGRRIVDLNAQALELLHAERPGALGADLAEWIVPEDRLRVLALLEGREEVLNTEFDSLRPDGSRSTVTCSSALLPDGQRIVHLVDVTARRRMEEAVQKMQRLESIGLLAGGIAHDFNNLLSGIFGNIELASTSLDMGNSETARERLQKTLNVFERAKDLTRQLLTFSKGGAPILKRTDIGALAAEVFRFTLSGSDVALEAHVEGDVPECDADANQMSQVFSNLAMNARQAMPGGGLIRLSVSVADRGPDGSQGDGSGGGPYVLITVEDQGPGIPDEILERLFLPFVTTKVQGTGLGLATSFSIVQRHKGFMEGGNSPGGGARFRIWMPVAGGRSFSPPE